MQCSRTAPRSAFWVRRAAWVGIFTALAGPGAICHAQEIAPSVNADTWRPLVERADPGLDRELSAALRKNGLWAGLLDSERMAVGIVDLSDPDLPRFARANGDTMMYAASLPKIAVLLAAYVSMERGTLEETSQIHQDLVAMIRRSSNSAATRMIDRIGFQTIEEVLTDPKYALYDADRGGGLWVGKRYAKAGERHPDPIKGLSHAATVTQVCRLYYLLASGRIITPERSREMLEVLADPAIHHKFVCVIEELAPEAKMYRKSGTWRNWHCDSVMVLGKVWRKYILVALVEDPAGEQILRDLVPVVEGVLGPGPAVAPDAGQ